MLKLLLILLCCFCLENCLAQHQNALKLENARFSTGNDDSWRAPSFNDRDWKMIRTGEVWQSQGYPNYHGYAWYRIHVIIPSALKRNAIWGDSLRINLAHVNDVDETYLNGVKIGKTGAYPTDPGGYISKWPAERNYCLAVNNIAIKWDADNVIAIKVYDGGGTGGIFMGTPFIDMLEKADGIEFPDDPVVFLTNGRARKQIILKNRFNTTVSGTLHYKINDAAAQHIVKAEAIKVILGPFRSSQVPLNFPHREGIELIYNFHENDSGTSLTHTCVAPYILTPAAPRSPVINGPAIFGTMAGHPILYKIPASGATPMVYNVKGLPAGLTVDQNTGTISGRIASNGSYQLVLSAANRFGSCKRHFTIVVGNKLSLTPPMGWNSWNCWGLTVSAEKVKNSADALIKKGLDEYGWSYINVDDGWQAAGRAVNGEILPNDKFPRIKDLAGYLHHLGLKFGIYSSPGPLTCGGFTGSLGHEALDAATYSRWGVDYLKYDLCSYTDIIGDDTSLAAQQKPYILMRDELNKQQRDIVYSICQYGIQDVWKWGRQMNGNLWRTTEDITDTWNSLYNIGFRQDSLSDYAHPGGWNDPDMLIVGMVGWGENLHPSHLTPYEQYTHISLWALLSAPLLIGCDIGKLDDFTLNLLKNNEVIAVDQDVLGNQAHKLIDKNNFQVWVKTMNDGSHVIGIFNINNKYARYLLKLSDVSINTPSAIRDVWRKKTLGQHLSKISFNIPPHGVRLLKVSK